MPNTPQKTFTRLATIAALLLPAAGAAGQGLPVTGSPSECAALTYSHQRLVVTQGLPDCVINWESFDIDAGNLVEFMQPESWRLMNHVSSDAFSTIAGTLRAGGTIYIVNPAGVFFTGSAVVDVGGIYAAGAALDPEEFRDGVDRFVTPSGAVINEGSITGRMVHLIGNQISNRGSIVSDGGVVTMVAGAQEVMLSEDGGRVSVRIDGIDLTSDLAVSPGGVVPTLTGPAGVENTGTVDAVGGQISLGVGDLYALAIRNTGRLDASGGSAQLAALGGTVTHTGPDAALTAGVLAVTGDVIHLDGGVNATSARFNDPVVIGSDVRIEGENADSDADDVVFAASVDSGDAAYDLDVNAAHTTFGGDVGAGARLATVDVSGEADIARNVHTTEAIRIGGDAAFTEDGAQVLDAGGGVITAGGGLVKTTSNSLTLRAGTRVDIAGDVTVDRGRLLMETALVNAGGDLTSGNGEVRINGAADIDGSVSAGTGVIVTGAARIGGGVSAQKDVRFLDTANVGGDVTAVEDVRFTGDAVVGGTIVSGIDVDFFGTADVGGNVIAGDDVTFRGDAAVGGGVTAAQDVDFLGTADVGGVVAAGDDAVFAAFARVGGVTATDDVTFEREAIVAGDVFAGGDAEFLDSATVGGTVTALDDVEFFTAASVGGNVVAGDDARFHDLISVGGDVDAGDDIDFLATAVVGGSVSGVDDVTFFADATVGGDAFAGDDVRFLANAEVGGGVDAVGDVEFAGAAQVGGTVSAGDDVVFAGAATLGGDVLAVDRITFDGVVTLNGGGDQRLAAGGSLRANDNLIKTTGGSLALSSGEVLILNGAMVQAIDDIFLSPEGRTTVPSVATITGNSDLAIVSLAGDVVMGPNEKLTVLGTLRLSAGRELVLGDITTLDDLFAIAPSIRIRPREAGLVLDDDGIFTLDAGVDFVAGGRFYFSTTPRLLDGTQGGFLFASARADGDAFGTLSGFRPLVTSPLRRSLLRRDGVVLDFRANGAPIAELATAFADDPARPAGRRAPDTPDLQADAIAGLQRLGLRPRPTTASERAEARAGRTVYNDLLPPGATPAGDITLAAARLDGSAVVRGLRAYETIEADTGVARAALTDAWEDYKAQGDTPDGTGFRRYLESRPEAAQALARLDELRDVFRQLRGMGATSAEVRAAAASIVAGVTPEEMSAEVMIDAIGTASTG